MKKIALICFLFFLTAPLFAVKYFNRSLCDNPAYMCYKTKHGDTWKKLFPLIEQEDLVRRINRTNGYMRLGMKIAIPNELHRSDLFDHAPFPDYIEPNGRKTVIIDIERHAFGAFDEEGYLVHWGPISAGKDYCADVGRRCTTPYGKFYFFRKQGANCISTKFPIPNGGSPMPFCMFFKGGFAMHGGYLPGYHASHGCVRLFYRDAEWLNKKFIDLGKNATRLIVR